MLARRSKCNVKYNTLWRRSLFLSQPLLSPRLPVLHRRSDGGIFGGALDEWDEAAKGAVEAEVVAAIGEEDAVEEADRYAHVMARKADEEVPMGVAFEHERERPADLSLDLGQRYAGERVGVPEKPGDELPVTISGNQLRGRVGRT